ncbi:MAG: type II and III secretion system protein family protein, partial [Planctomycetota bacterium]
SEVDVEVFNGAIVLSGRVPDVDMIDRIVSLAEAFAPNVRNQMVLAGEQQVLLRCTVVELNKRAIRQLGVNGWLAGDNIRDMWAVTQIGGINPSNISLSPIDNMMPTLDSNAIAFGTPGVPLGPSPQLSLIFPRAQMQLFFQALRRNNLLRVLAEPNLIALNGQTASFLAGGEFPIPVSQGISGAVTVEFREFGVRLSFTPTIIGRGMIRLHVTPEVSELDFSAAVVVGGFNVPGLTQRRAETTIELASGSTIAIAGLLKEELAGVVERIPGLGDIPILGQLFRSVDYRSQITELVILVTPEVVSAMGPDQVAALPGDSISIPDDWELFGLGLLEGQGSIPEPDSEEALKDKVSPKYRKYSGSPEQMSLHGPWGMAAASEVTE